MTKVDLRVITLDVPQQEVRYMQTLLDMGSNQNSTIVFPIPIELIRPLLAAPVQVPAARRHERRSASQASAPAIL